MVCKEYLINIIGNLSLYVFLFCFLVFNYKRGMFRYMVLEIWVIKEDKKLVLGRERLVLEKIFKLLLNRNFKCSWR